MDGPETLTFSYTDPSSRIVTEVTFDMAFQWGNRDRNVSGQIVARNRGGNPYVYESGEEYRQFDWHLRGFDYINREKWERFFASSKVGRACKWFTVTFKPTSCEILRCNAVVGGVAVTCGTTYSAGQRILMDSITHAVRLTTPDFDWEENEDGRFDLDVTLDVLGDTRPSNLRGA